MPPANGINCIHQLLYQLLHAYSDIVYSIQIAFHSIVVRLAMLGAAANVVSQIVYQRTSDSVWCTNSVTVQFNGILNNNYCFLSIFTIVQLSLTDQRSSAGCRALCYTIVILYFVYEASKLSTQTQSVFIMYQCCKIHFITSSNKKLFCNYAVSVQILSVCCNRSSLQVPSK